MDRLESRSHSKWECTYHVVHGDFDSAEVRGVARRGVYQGQERHPFGACVRRTEAEFRGTAFLDAGYFVFKPGVADALRESDRILTAIGGRRKFLYQHVLKGFSVGDLPNGALELLRANPLVAEVERVAYEHVVTTQYTGFDSNLWGLDRVDQRSPTLDYNFTYIFNGQGVRIYILDTGIDPARRLCRTSGGRRHDGRREIRWT